MHRKCRTSGWLVGAKTWLDCSKRPRYPDRLPLYQIYPSITAPHHIPELTFASPLATQASSSAVQALTTLRYLCRPLSRYQYPLGPETSSTLTLADGRPCPRRLCLVGGGAGAFSRRLWEWAGFSKEGPSLACGGVSIFQSSSLLIIASSLLQVENRPATKLAWKTVTMLSSSRVLLLVVSSLLLLASFVSAHTVITYPGWRGDNLQKNGSLEETGGLGVGPNNTYPYGMQWIYPCMFVTKVEILIFWLASRRRNANDHEPNQVANPRRGGLCPARMVYRSPNCFLLHKPWDGNTPAEHVVANDACFSDRRSIGRWISRTILLTTSSITSWI